MAATTLTPIVPKGPYPGTVAANALDIALAALDDVNGNDFVGSGDDLLIVYNASASQAETFTLDSKPGREAREADISAYSLGQDELAAFRFSDLTGWADTVGKINITGSSDDLKVAVLRL